MSRYQRPWSVHLVIATSSERASKAAQDLLECAWPGMLKSLIWRAALAVTVDPAVIVAMGEQQLLAVRDSRPRRPGNGL